MKRNKAKEILDLNIAKINYIILSCNHTRNLWNRIICYSKLKIQNSVGTFQQAKNPNVIKEGAVEVKKRNIKTAVFVGRGSNEHDCQVACYFFETYFENTSKYQRCWIKASNS